MKYNMNMTRPVLKLHDKHDLLYQFVSLTFCVILASKIVILDETHFFQIWDS